jgi:hypothetical protein
MIGYDFPYWLEPTTTSRLRFRRQPPPRTLSATTIMAPRVQGSIPGAHKARGQRRIDARWRVGFVPTWQKYDRGSRRPWSRHVARGRATVARSSLLTGPARSGMASGLASPVVPDRLPNCHSDCQPHALVGIAETLLKARQRVVGHDLPAGLAPVSEQAIRPRSILYLSASCRFSNMLKLGLLVVLAVITSTSGALDLRHVLVSA